MDRAGLVRINARGDRWLRQSLKREATGQAPWYVTMWILNLPKIPHGLEKIVSL